MLAEFSLVPIGGGTSLSKYIAKAVKLVEASGLKYRLTSMGTILEGKWDEVMKVVKKAHHKVLADNPRVITHISIDDRKGKTGRLNGKIKSVEKILRQMARK